MGWQPEQGSGRDENAARNPGLPGMHSGSGSGGAGLPLRDEELTGFAPGGAWDVCPPSAALAAALEGASGEEWRCPGATHDELIGLLRQWAALESHAAAGRLGVLRALMREEDLPPNGGHHGDLPDGWSKSLTREVALALATSARGAEHMMWLAWDLQARLPGIGQLLADGTLNYGKAKAIGEELNLLTDPEAEQAERLILARLAEDGSSPKGFSQVLTIAQQAAVTVNPDIATLRRKDAEQTRARVTRFREQSGAAALCGRDLPTDEVLSAYANVNARAEEYQASEAFADARTDQLRAMAYVDLLSGTSADERIAAAQADETQADLAADEPPGSDDHDQDDGGAPGPDDGGPDGSGGSGDSGPDPGPVPPSGPEWRPRLSDLVIPLATLLGLAGRPGEGHGLGPLDPSLCRDLAAAAAGSPHSEWCVTVTDHDGIAIGHGCAGPARPAEPLPGRRALPGRVNLTITSTQLEQLARPSGPSGPPQASGQPGARAPAAFAFTPRDDPGPPGGYGNWALTLPGMSDRIVKLEPVPTFDCDHRRESRAYQPNAMLRHLVQVRDYQCTYPTCTRHARESDFEHALPYDKGGRSCGCNAGARSRQCHIVKQSPGWTVTQPKPGWHQWQTPGARTYLRGPYRYPV